MLKYVIITVVYCGQWLWGMQWMVPRRLYQRHSWRVAIYQALVLSHMPWSVACFLSIYMLTGFFELLSNLFV